VAALSSSTRLGVKRQADLGPGNARWRVRVLAGQARVQRIRPPIALSGHAAAAKRYEKSAPPTVVVLAREIPVSRSVSRASTNDQRVPARDALRTRPCLGQTARTFDGWLLVRQQNEPGGVTPRAELRPLTMDVVDPGDAIAGAPAQAAGR
jgi:hypothetical protein